MLKKHISFLIGAILLISVMPDSLSAAGKQEESCEVKRGNEALASDDYPTAIEWFRKALDANPKDGAAHADMARACYNNNQPGEALNSASAALKYLSRKNKEKRARVYELRGNVYLQLLDSVKALADFNEAVALCPDEEFGYDSRGQLLFELNRFDESDADYRRISKISPGSSLGYMGLGRNALRQHRWNDAVKLFDEALLVEPSFATANAFRAEAYIGAEDYDKAADDLVTALESDNSKAFYMIGNLSAPAARKTKARLMAKKLKEPSNRLWAYYLGALCEGREEYEEAARYYQQANDIDSNSIFLERAATCMWNLHRPLAALDLLNRAVDINADDNDLYVERAVILESAGRPLEAIENLDTYLARNPDDAQCYARRSWLRHIVGDCQTALEDIETALALDPDRTSYNLRRARVNRCLGREDEALADLKRALELAQNEKEYNPEMISIVAGYLGDRTMTLAAIDSMRCVADTLSDAEQRRNKFYNMACGYALISEPDSAVALLDRAAATDHVYAADVLQDPDLNSLHSDERFITLIDTLKARQDRIEGPITEIALSDSVAAVVSDTVAVPFTKEGGVTKVRCTINDLPLYFVFDTGAADVTVSMVEANFMIKNGYIKPEDIIGTTRYMDANGDVSEGTVVNLRRVEFGGETLENVRASVVRNQKAPLLLGQSVLGRLGRIVIDNKGSSILVIPR